jgi:hypothetical protein
MGYLPDRHTLPVEAYTLTEFANPGDRLGSPLQIEIRLAPWQRLNRRFDKLIQGTDDAGADSVLDGFLLIGRKRDGHGLTHFMLSAIEADDRLLRGKCHTATTSQGVAFRAIALGIQRRQLF